MLTNLIGSILYIYYDSFKTDHNTSVTNKLYRETLFQSIHVWKEQETFHIDYPLNTRLPLARLTQLVYVDIARVHKIVLIKNFFAHRHMHM